MDLMQQLYVIKLQLNEYLTEPGNRFTYDDFKCKVEDLLSQSEIKLTYKTLEPPEDLKDVCKGEVLKELKFKDLITGEKLHFASWYNANECKDETKLISNILYGIIKKVTKFGYKNYFKLSDY